MPFRIKPAHTFANVNGSPFEDQKQQSNYFNIIAPNKNKQNKNKGLVMRQVYNAQGDYY